MREPGRTLELADRGAASVYDEICRRAAGETPDPRFDAYVDYLADAAEAIAGWEWPGERPSLAAEDRR